MEKQLVEIREALRALSDIQNLDDANPIPVRVQNSTVRRVHTAVCALREPYNEILPLNVIWFDFNPQSVYYNTARRRVSKDPDTSTGTTHTWEVIDTMAEYNEPQYYDQEDADILNQVNPVPPASVTVLGIARLSTAPANGAAPVAVSDNDPRMTDARKPTEHTHAEKPAAQLKTKTDVINIGNSATPVIGATLVSSGNKTAVWRQLTSADIQK